MSSPAVEEKNMRYTNVDFPFTLLLSSQYIRFFWIRFWFHIVEYFFSTCLSV